MLPFTRVQLEGYHLAPTDWSYAPANHKQLNLTSLSVTVTVSPYRGHNEETKCNTRVIFPQESTTNCVTFQGGQPCCSKQSRKRGRKAHLRKTTNWTHEEGRGNGIRCLKELNELLMSFNRCGPVVHTDALWLGASPDGLLYDPLERPSFGLVEIKCPNVQKLHRWQVPQTKGKPLTLLASPVVAANYRTFFNRCQRWRLFCCEFTETMLCYIVWNRKLICFSSTYMLKYL